MSDQGKKVGVVGGILAVIGAAVAHGADDCARVGARSAAEVGAVRGATQAGDDIARVGARGVAEGVGVEGAGVRGARGIGAPAVAGEMPALKLGGGVAADEAAAGKPWRDLAEEMGQELAPDALEQVLGLSDSDADPTDDAVGDATVAPPKSGAGFAFVSLVPSERVGFALAFGAKAEVKSLDALLPVNQPSKRLRVSVPSSRIALQSALAASPNPIARFVLGYLAPDDSRSLATPDPQFSIPVAEIAARCLSAGASCLILACERLDVSEKKPCASASRELIDAAVAEAPRSSRQAIAQLTKQRKERGVNGLALYAPVRLNGKLKLAASPSKE